MVLFSKEKEEERIPWPNSADVTPVAKHVFLRTDSSLCICQRKPDEILSNSRDTSYTKFFEHVSKRSEYRYKNILSLRNVCAITVYQLKNSSAKWHRTCYSSATHTAW